jgi:hypothetical protein
MLPAREDEVVIVVITSRDVSVDVFSTSYVEIFQYVFDIFVSCFIS